MTDEMALRAAIELLRDSVTARRTPSGQPLDSNATAQHEQAAERLEALLHHQPDAALRELIDAIPIHVWTTRADGSDAFFNRQRLDYTGPGVDWYAIVHPDEREKHDATWHASVRTGQPFEFEQRLIGADGNSRWFLGRAAPLRDKDGNITRWVGVNIDIEDRKRAEQVQADAEQQLKTVIDTIPAHVWRTGPDGENDFVNQARIAFGGGDLNWHNFAHPDDAIVHQRLWANARQTGEPFEQEMRLLRRDGVYRWFLVRVAPQRNADGTVARWFGTNTDIDDMKRAQERVRRSEQDLSDAIDTIPTHVWSTLPDGSDLYVNRRPSRMSRTPTTLRSNSESRRRQNVPARRGKSNAACKAPTESIAGF